MIRKLTLDEFEVNHLCQVLEVSRSAFYQWKEHQNTIYELQDQQLGPLIEDVFHEHKKRYGARRISREIKARGQSCSRSKAKKIMDQMHLKAIGPKSFTPRTTQSRHALGYNENLLLNDLNIEHINQLWVGDITYISLQKAFAYLAVLMDRFSRKIVGWALRSNMDATLVIDALKEAIAKRQPIPGLIHHSDRGGQYAAKSYREILKRAEMKQSMSRVADCYDNAFMESCFGTIKRELELTSYSSLQAASKEINEYINYYNTIRRHSSLDYLSPTRFEKENNS